MSDSGEPSRVRLDAFLARAGVGTRSQVKRIVRQGRAALDGTVCKHASELVAGRQVTFDGRVVEAKIETLHVVLHKPVGFACSHDLREAPLVDDLLPDAWASLGLQAAGRLDRATSGLLVLSTDGALVHALTHPGRKLEKRYRVHFEGELPTDAVARCLAGFVIEGSERPTRPARLVVEGPGRATIFLREGRFHQVRRMFERLGAPVLALHRDAVGGYVLPEDLAPGELRRLDDDDLGRLRSESTL